MKEDIKVFYRFCARFGVIKGWALFLRFYFGRVRNLQIPGIAHRFSLRTGTSDYAMFFDIFLKKEYDVKLEQQPRIIIDGGANIGLFAILMKNRYPDAKIICIEPDSENFKLLQKNVSLYDNIYCENSALWNVDAPLKVYDKYNHGKCGMVVEEDPEGTVSAISVNTLLDKYAIDRIDVLKIDIESSEKQVFSSDFTAWMSKVDTIFIELHDHIVRGCAQSFFEAVVACFSKWSFFITKDTVIIKNHQ
ncbi:MAG: FkbM family methyltransferase [Bacteroidales bacterium]|jgi:FkbM family methyltransferase|nr:FkbM family methyltransferase [Bacteroidales bacterium]